MTRVASAAVIVVAILGGGCSGSDLLWQRSDPPPLQKAVDVHGLPLDGTVDRARAESLAVTLIDFPRDSSDLEVTRLLGDGTFYRLERESGVISLVRFADVTHPELDVTRLPLVAPPGETIRSEFGHYATRNLGLTIDRDGRGAVWWEEDGPEGRQIEFRIDGNNAVMSPPSSRLDDPKAPIARRFDVTPEDREISFRLTSGAVDVPKGTPRANLGRGWGVALARIGDWKNAAFAELSADDIPRVDAAEHPP